MDNTQLARIFAMYFGCKYIDKTDEEPEMTTIDGETITCIERYPKAMSTAKLILKQLSEISDEDAIEVAKIYGCDMNSAYKDDDETKFIDRDDEFGDIRLNFWHKTSVEYDEGDVYPLIINSKGEVYDHMGVSNNQNAITNYLRSKGYDCDNLIENGLAIKKEVSNG